MTVGSVRVTLARVAWDVASTQQEVSAERDASASGGLRLVVISPDGTHSLPLPENGRITIGRAPENPIVVDDPLISRVHAALHLDGGVELEDLGSANGTRLSGALVRPGERYRLAAGAVFDLGSTMLIVQRVAPRSRSKRLWSHSSLELRLEEECARPSRTPRSPFALLRVRIDGGSRVTDVEGALTHDLRGGDLIAAYAPNEYEILLLDTSRGRAEGIAREIASRLSRPESRVLVGLAVYPEGGLSAQELIASAAPVPMKSEGAKPGGAVVEDPAMIDLYRVIERVAQGSISVLFLGETGVGKEVVAEALHKRSPRRDGPFVRLNCAALSETLVESELFGHEKGAFTGANAAKQGLMEAANGGTLFLDEIGELPFATQAKLLRAIEQREVLRVGALKPRQVDVRLVSATNRDLESETAAQRFRQDLFFRLSGVTLVVPPLRHRPSEIEPLANLFLERTTEDLGLARAPELTPATIELLKRYSWPGNIRELRNVMERAVLLTAGDLIEPIHLPFEKLTTAWPSPPAGADPVRSTSDLPRATDDPARARILEALERCAGNQTRAAEILGVSRQTLSKWMSRYELPRPRKGNER